LVKRITDDEKRRILDSFRSGTKKSEISRKFEISLSTVTRIINNFQNPPAKVNKLENIFENPGSTQMPEPEKKDSIKDKEMRVEKAPDPIIDQGIMELARNLSEVNLNVEQVETIINIAKKIRKNGNTMEQASQSAGLSIPEETDFDAMSEFIEYYNQKQQMQTQLESVRLEKDRHEKIRNDLVDEIINLESKLSSLAIKIGKSEQTIRKMGYLLGDAENKGRMLQLKLEGITETAAISKAFDDIIKSDRISHGSIYLSNKLPMFKDLSEEEARKKILQMLDNFLMNHDEDSNITGKRLPREELVKLREDSYLLSDIIKELEGIAFQKDSIITYLTAPNLFTILSEKLSKTRESRLNPTEIILTVETVNDRIKIMDNRNVE